MEMDWQFFRLIRRDDQHHSCPVSAQHPAAITAAWSHARMEMGWQFFRLILQDETRRKTVTLGRSLWTCA
jgi:hypothetical protein